MTENLRKNIHKVNPNDTISITYKTHGTSWWVSNVLAKKQLKWYEILLQKLGVNVVDMEYDIIYGSRRVVKNKYADNDKAKDHFYSYDLWADIKDQVADKIPKGYTLYGECLGYTKDGGFIQNPYDYGCNVGEFKLEVYRITHTTPDGLVIELSYPEIAEFCERVGLTPSHLFYYGTVKGFLDESEIDPNQHWQENFIQTLENSYNEKDCFMCKNKVPEEGIVLRKESLFNCESYKLKSFRFLESESRQLDKGELNIEDQ